jgi:hypothetical protein
MLVALMSTGFNNRLWQEIWHAEAGADKKDNSKTNGIYWKV